MKLIIDIPEEQIKKSLKESESFHVDEGVKGSVNIVMLYTNGRLEFVDVERHNDFYSCSFSQLPKGHGVLKDADGLLDMTKSYKSELGSLKADPFVKSGIETVEGFIKEMPTIIEADKAESEG